MRIGVIGTGHVGLITCVSLAAIGHEVVGGDNDPEKIALLERGVAPFYEPELQPMLEQQLREGRLTFTASPQEAVKDAPVVFICVGTPPRVTGDANLVAVEQAAASVAPHIADRAVVVEKSTVPSGTALRLKRTLQRGRAQAEEHLQVVSNPEFLREGKAVYDSMHPERILVGGEAEWAFEAMREVYKPLTDQGYPLIETSIPTAELSKHASNAFLAMKISFANALARICEKAGADVVEVADAMGADARIGRAFLNAGMGYGGSCFPKDVQAFEHLSKRLGYDFRLLQEVARINTEAIDSTLEKVRDALWNLEGKTVALLGLAFKPGTDDVRDAPALALGAKLLAQGATVVGYDPLAAANAKDVLPELQLAPDPISAASGADCVVICTEWPEIRDLDAVELKEAMAYPVVVDGRNAFDPETMANHGFVYYPTGRPALN
ncbi:MAG: UDP-glucose/GDP-mannose dehydrogenase family protein [Actinomycetota bacterium]|nr:UDP-glucose/GDP-mannose dehydrogenase family protein [Actinomycetota bacterium]